MHYLKSQHKYYSIRLFLLFVMLGITSTAFAQYPDVPKEARERAEQAKQAAWESVNAKWEAAKELRDSLETHGKPYIPWASTPSDLPQANIPAFPGAQGGGMYTFGGRGGDVYVVTSLADHGPGTFREALESVGPRIVVFNVAGIIRLEKPLIVKAPYITIAGQTAPGDGVCIAGESVWINTHDVIIRHMRFRRGATDVGRRDDAIGGSPVGNIMIDHVSASWGLDENMSMYRHMYNPNPEQKDRAKLPTVNITIQNSIFAEGLDTYNHSFASTIGGLNSLFTRNLWASNTGRNPSIGSNGIFNFVNNVVFNWRHRSVDGGSYKTKYNIINNYYKPGPVTPDDEPVGYRILKPEAGRSNLDYTIFGKAYVHGNIMEGYPAITENNWAGGVQFEGNDGELMSYWESTAYFPNLKSKNPFPMPPVTIMPTRRAYEFVLEHAGATLPKRDEVDQRIIRQVRTGNIEYVKGLDPEDFYQFKYRRLGPESYKKGIITDISQVGGYPEYTGEPYQDSDGDGMPNAYEKKYKNLGLNPNEFDANGDINNDGYTNIEMYINGIDPRTSVDWTEANNNYNTLADEAASGGLLESI